MKKLNKIIVHGGIFHLDDVVCCALAKIVNPDVIIERNNKPDINEAGPETGILIADVGMVYDPEHWLFDHHMDRYDTDSDPATVRAACGRVWDYFGSATDFPSLTAYIRAVDLHDTGVQWSPLGVINCFAPNWDDGFTMKDGFEFALEHVMQLIWAMIRKDYATKAAYDAVAKCPVEDEVILMQEFLPWSQYAAAHPEIKAVIFPGRDLGTWNVSIAKDHGTFPEEWLNEKPEGLVFMPAWRTMAVADSVERAKEFAKSIEYFA